MFYHPDLIIYLWLFPLFFFVLLPLIVFIIDFTFSVTRQIFLAETTAGKENRKHPRLIPYDGILAEISTGETICTGVIRNMSMMGISLKHLPDKFFDKMDKLTLVIKGYDIDHNLQISPRWIADAKSGKQIGAEIIKPSPGWNQFLLQAEKISQSGRIPA